MKSRTSLMLGALAAAGLLTTGLASATSNAGSLPPEMTQGSVKYMSGGVGKEQEAAMRNEMAKYPLSLEFAKRASPAPEHLSGVSVTIKNMAGKTELDTVANGPYLLVRLPAGRYRISATDNGKVETRNVVIAANQKPEHVTLEW